MNKASSLGQRKASVENVMCVVSPVVTELKETKMSGGCRRIAVASVFLWPNGQRGQILPPKA